MKTVMEELQWLWNTLTIIGTVSGVIGLIVSCVTLRKTKNAKEAADKAKSEVSYLHRLNEFSKAVAISITSIFEGSREYFIVSNLYKASLALKRTIKNWDVSSKTELYSFIDFLANIPPDQRVDEITRVKLQNKLNEISTLVELKGENNDFGQI